MKDTDFQPTPSHHYSRRRVLKGIGGLGTLALVGAGCTTHEDPDEGSVISQAEKAAQFYPLSSLARPNAVTEIGSRLIQTAGYLRLIDQDVTYYNVFGKTTSFDRSANEQEEELTYDVAETPTRNGAKLYAVRKRIYKSILGGAALNEHVTEVSNRNQLWQVTGYLRKGIVEIGDSSNDKVNAVYLDIRGIYRK